MNNKKLLIVGKKNTDSFIPEKEKRIKIDALDFELDEEETIYVLSNFETTKEVKYRMECKKSLEQKIAGYKSQDIKKQVYDKDTIITLPGVIDKLLTSTLKCVYCKKTLKVLYRMVRDPLQWTLDRIDNDLSHNVSNTVISCLSCNLKRRTTNKEKFIFSQNIKIVKSE